MQEIEKRVDHIEWRLEYQDEKLEEVRIATEKLECSLIGIETNVNQIKWIFIGMGIAYLASEFGILRTLGAII